LALSRVGIVCALASEARHLGRATLKCEPFATLADGTLLAVTGMGEGAAASGARALIGAGATALASWGMAGGLDPALTAGTILLPEEVIHMDGRRVATAPGWRQRLAQALASQRPQAEGRLLSSPKAIGSAALKASVYRATGAVAVDMESFAVGEAAAACQLPFMTVRVVVDSAADDLPEAVTRAADEEGHLHLWRLIAALARTPAELAPVLRLARRYRAANRSLALVARLGPFSNITDSAHP